MTPQQNAVVAKTSERAMEYVPFGAADKIRLTIEIVKNIIAIPTKTGKACSDKEAMKFMMLCQAQRLNPFAGDAFLTGYDSRDGGAKFSLITAHIAFLKRAESSPDFEGMESGIIIQNEDGAISEREGDFSVLGEKVVGGWAKVYRKGRRPTYRRLSIEQRKPPYPTQFWEGFKAHEQIVKCSEADALRATFPTLLGGLHGEGEIVNIEATVSPADMPTRMLAASVGALPEQERGVTNRTQEGASNPNAELEAIVIGGGSTFDNYRKFGEENGDLPDAGMYASFADIPIDVVKRHIKAKVGLLKALAQMTPAKPQESA